MNCNNLLGHWLLFFLSMYNSIALSYVYSLKQNSGVLRLAMYLCSFVDI